jgi:hypothetical protein
MICAPVEPRRIGSALMVHAMVHARPARSCRRVPMTAAATDDGAKGGLGMKDAYLGDMRVPAAN